MFILVCLVNNAFCHSIATMYPVVLCRKIFFDKDIFEIGLSKDGRSHWLVNNTWTLTNPRNFADDNLKGPQRSFFFLYVIG